MSRQLASIQRIKEIRPIAGADRIEVAQILNWECVIKKDEFKVGDLILYIEIDSLLPDIPMFEWLKGSSWSQKLNKYKIKTHIFRNQVSQGLILSIDQLKEFYKQIDGEHDIYVNDLYIPTEGDDLTELLGIEKYDPPVCNGPLGEIISHEWYVDKTDEDRIQICAEKVLPAYLNVPSDTWYASIKVDGASCTAGLFEDMFLIGGRAQWYKDDNMYTTTVKKYGDLENKLRDYQKETGLYVVFQGELCGPGIQSNRMGLKEKEWYIFNVLVSETGRINSYHKCDYDDILKLCDKFGLQHVPIVSDITKYDFTQTNDIFITVSNLLSYANTIHYKDYFENAKPNQLAEGIVFRKKDMSNSFKVISNKYLLKNGE